MLLPMTSRLLLVAFSPERPCWKPMLCCPSSVERLDGGVRDAAGMRQLERQAVGARAHGLDLVAHERRRLDRGGAGVGGDAEGVAAVAGDAGGRGPREVVAAGLERAQLQRVGDAAR